MNRIALVFLLLCLGLTPAAAQNMAGWTSVDASETPACVHMRSGEVACIAWDGTGTRINSLVAGNWSGWTRLSGAIASAPSCINPAAGRLTCFARGTDNALWRFTRTGQRLNAWEKMSGEMTDAPSCVSPAENRLSCFVRGTDSFLYRLEWDGTAWRGWFGLDVAIQGSPQCIAGAQSRIECFARTSDKGALVHVSVQDGKWSPVDALGGEFTGPPSCIRWTAVGLNCFVQGTDNVLYHAWWNGKDWGGWEGLAGILTAPPACVSMADSRLDCFVRGTDMAVWRRRWDGDRWLDWENLGGDFTTGPSCLGSSGVADCFALAAGGKLMYRRLSEH